MSNRIAARSMGVAGASAGRNSGAPGMRRTRCPRTLPTVGGRPQGRRSAHDLHDGGTNAVAQRGGIFALLPAFDGIRLHTCPGGGQRIAQTTQLCRIAQQEDTHVCPCERAVIRQVCRDGYECSATLSIVIDRFRVIANVPSVFLELVGPRALCGSSVEPHCTRGSARKSRNNADDFSFEISDRVLLRQSGGLSVTVSAVLQLNCTAPAKTH